MRCVAQWLSPQGKADAFPRTNAGLCAAARAILRYKGEPDIACYHLPDSCQQHTLCVPLIARAEAIGLLSFQNLRDDSAPSRAVSGADGRSTRPRISQPASA